MSTITNGLDVLSPIILHTKYARYLRSEKRREIFEETVARNENSHLARWPHLATEIKAAYDLVRKKIILPSMRSMQFAGAAINANNARGFNCCYLPVDSVYAFSETMFLLLGGSGVGYSVERDNITKLPSLLSTKDFALLPKQRYVIEDSIMGWADSIKVLIKAYTGLLDFNPQFDFTSIREKGSILVTAGGKAPGPEPLRECLARISLLLSQAMGRQLSSIECHDIQCLIADAVLAGGIRRAAMIAFFDKDDREMGMAKSGAWWTHSPWRARANNSVVAYRPTFSHQDFLTYWKWVIDSGCGEPGIYWTNCTEARSNPCAEASLRPFTFCNLCEINASLITSQEEFNKASYYAALIGTLQAAYTDFHYLRPIWKEETEKDALIGVGITGIANANFLKLNFEEAAQQVVTSNNIYSRILGINSAARSTLIKPSGTTSAFLGTSSGLHNWEAEYFIRRIRIGKTESIYPYLLENMPSLVEDDKEKPNLQAILSLPCKAPPGALTRKNSSAIELLERMKKLQLEWVFTGHNRGINPHSCSITVSIMDHEWDKVGKWLWENKNEYACVSVLPYDGGTYVQAPFEEITKEQFEELSIFLPKTIDLSTILEEEDGTSLIEELACAGGSCEIKF